MNTDDIGSLNVFLTEYIISLSERTRQEKTGFKLGFDQLIYSLALANDWQPIRIPFFRQDEYGKTTAKTEAEFGIDLAFQDTSKTGLYIFVLKDEALTNSNWTAHNFDKDIRMAAAPDLQIAGLESVKTVKVILAYNKDEDNNGVELYDRLVGTLGTVIKDNVSLAFERWNLSRIVEETKKQLLSPELLPLHLSRQFRDICTEVHNYNYGTTDWEEKVRYNWRKFLDSLLEPPVDVRKLNLIPVMLFILHNYRKETPDSYPGWIDLIEWAILAIWQRYQGLSDNQDDTLLKQIIERITVALYINELNRYLLHISPVMTVEHGFGNTGGGHLSAINDSYLIYWHTSRLGILAIGCSDFNLADADKIINSLSSLVIACFSTNPGIFRPLIDLHHIDLFLIWFLLMRSGQQEEICRWLTEVESRLTIRRARKGVTVPFIESRNRMDLVAEYLATSNRPPEYTDSSSYLVLMLMELCFCLDDTNRDALLDRYYRRVVNGIGDDSSQIADNPLDLMSWVPPQDWNNRILKEPVYDGVGITTHNFSNLGENKPPLKDRIQDFVREVRKQHPWDLPKSIPPSIAILACLKHGSPLPPEYWREILFQETENKNGKGKNSRS